MAYAIIKTGGKQVKVTVGQPIWIEKLNSDENATFTFDEVVALHDGTKLHIGKPTVAGATVTGTVQKQGKGKKLIIFRTKAKSNWKRKQGHRQPYTRVMIDSINLGGAKSAAAPKAAEPKQEVEAKAEE